MGRPQKKRAAKSFVAQQVEKLLFGKNFAEFERDVDLPPTTIRRIMDGKEPRISTMAKIARGCGVSLDYFIEGDEVSETRIAEVVAKSDIVRQVFAIQEKLAEIGRGVVDAQSSGTAAEAEEFQRYLRETRQGLERLASALQALSIHFGKPEAARDDYAADA